jgi:hypothetical protein
MESAARLEKRLGLGDRRVMGEYLDSVRDVERRIQRAEQNNAASPLPTAEAPGGVPDGYDAHARLLMDLLILGYRGDITRVSCLQMGRELSNRTYPEIGVPERITACRIKRDPQHRQKTKVDATTCRSSRACSDHARHAGRRGSLLDHSLLMYGAGMGDGDRHTPLDLPVVLAGGAHGRLKGGRHVKYEMNTPFMNLCRTVLEKVDVSVEKIGDSTGLVSGL